ncbi:MAG TPA: glycosyltransferase [Nitrospira sp.]|jgi:GT2 family glycosyltransferase|nr:glycosyltransferase [Nitrospira sp.]
MTPTSFSIIIPTYRRPEALQECVRALCQLDYPRESFDVIIVDDGGDIPLEPLLLPFSNHLRLKVLWQPNAGPAAARNFGAKQATGAFLAFTDDDCQPDTQWLLTLGSALASSQNVLVGGRTVNALTSNSYAEASQLIIDVVYAHYNSRAQDVQFFASNNMAVSAQAFDAIGGFNPVFRTSEDRDLCDRFRFHGYTLRYAPDAVILHAHTLTFRSYWKQHSGYGRGAWRFHSARAQRGSGIFRPDWGFYGSLFSAPFRQGPWRYAVRGVSLIALAQLANATGCLAQGLNRLWTGADPATSAGSRHR